MYATHSVTMCFYLENRRGYLRKKKKTTTHSPYRRRRRKLKGTSAKAFMHYSYQSDKWVYCSWLFLSVQPIYTILFSFNWVRLLLFLLHTLHFLISRWTSVFFFFSSKSSRRLIHIIVIIQVIYLLIHIDDTINVIGRWFLYHNHSCKLNGHVMFITFL